MTTRRMDERETATLATRARSGDRAAFDLLVMRLQGPAVGYASSLLNGDRDRAQDAVQAALLEAWRDLPALRDMAAFTPWLRRIVFKQCDRLRRAARTTTPISNLYDVPDGAPSPDDRLLRTGRRSAVRGAISALPMGERDAVVLFYLGGGSYRDVAEYLGISVTAVKSRLHSARRRLRQTMETAMKEMKDGFNRGEEGAVELPPEDRRGIEEAYLVLTMNFPPRDADLTLNLYTSDYELIFPEWFNEPTWDRQRLEREIRSAATRPPDTIPGIKMKSMIDDVLAVERTLEAGTVTQATLRSTWMKAGSHDPIPRIDTWVRTPEGWKMRRTLSLYERPKEK